MQNVLCKVRPGCGMPLTQKLLRVMRLTAFLLIVGSLHVAAGGVSQTVTLKGNNISLEKAFATIEQQTGFVVFCNYDLLRHSATVNLDVRDMPLKDFLGILLAERQLDFTVENKTILVKKKYEHTISPAGRLSTPIDFPSPPITVRGRILNEKGESVVASIIIKGTNQGTTSDNNGSFILDNVPERSTLIISAVGYEVQEIKANGESISVTLKIADNKLDEIQIIAYGTTTKRLNTGNVSTITSKDIEKQPVSNPIATLQGRVPGLEVTQETGVPGGGFRVRIRGTNSIANGNDPLYIIDGVPFTSTPLSFNETSGSVLTGGANPLNLLNPSDIQSIDVLKDADATAIYGSRGANGVILITTKKGQAGKTKTSVNSYFGSAKIAKKADMLNTEQYIQMREEAFLRDTLEAGDGDYDINGTWSKTRYTDWQKELIGNTAHINDLQVGLSGGEKLTQFSIGAGYHKETTVFVGNNSDRKISAHFSLNNTSANQKLKTSLSVNYLQLNTNLISSDLTKQALFLPPNAPSLYDSIGGLNWDPTIWSGENPNPLSYTKREYDGATNNLLANAIVSYSIFDDVNIKVSFGYTNTTSKTLATNPISSQPPTSALLYNSTTFSNASFNNWIIEPQLNWKKDYAKNHIKVLIGSTIMEQISGGQVLYANFFSSEALMKTLNAAPNIQPGGEYYSQYRYNAAFARLNYDYDERFIINLTGRRDGSSRFGPGKQFANFGAAGVAWIFSNENFVQNIFPFLSFGKLRVSYGTSGNDQIGDYQYLDLYSPTTPYQGVPGLTPARLFNSDFAWETNRKFEAGISLGFIKDRVLLGASYYKNRSSNQLIGYALPPNTGFTSVQSNFPATVQNTGLEIELNTQNINRKYFSWSTSFNISVPRNKLVAFPGLESSLSYKDLLIIGQPLSVLKLYEYTGIDSKAGLYTYRDVDNNGSMDINDQVRAKFIGQKYAGGLSNNIRYKGFELDFLFQFVKQTGADVLGTAWGVPGSVMINQPATVLNRWQQSGDQTDVQRYGISTAVIPYYYSSFSEKYVVDASYVRLKNISLAYNFSSAVIQKFRSEAIGLFIQAQNLLTLTNYKGAPDPETQSAVLPPLKTITAGIRFNF